MKESAIYRAFAIVFNVLTGVAISAVALGHYHHIITIAACIVAAALLGNEANKARKREERKQC